MAQGSEQSEGEEEMTRRVGSVGLHDNILDHPCWKSPTIFLVYPYGENGVEVPREVARKICEKWEWNDCTPIGAMVERRVLIRRSE